MSSGAGLSVELLVIIGVIGLLILVIQSMLRMPEPRVVVVQVEPPERRPGGCASLIIVVVMVVIALGLLASL